jgi:hypothetical protein
MKPIHEVDALKDFNELTKPDPRNLAFLRTIEERHAYLSSITLKETVPIEVIQLFETAKNLSLYSWFVYRFHQTSEMVAFSSTELALKIRFKLENPNSKNRITFNELIIHAIDNHWITKDNFSRLYQRAINIAEQTKAIEAAVFLDKTNRNECVLEDPTKEEIYNALEGLDLNFLLSIPKMRNDLAHGSKTLSPSSASTLKLLSEIINQIY